ncbi:MAG: hypothetical protein D6722_16980 [Bacteroidetes bacterium]|nr:MAG: hypothetical protein D6722_16980 [Bacteroidota bacterium]
MSIWLLILFLMACQPPAASTSDQPRRFFASNSFWNQPIGPDPALAPQSGAWIDLLAQDPSCEHIGINVESYTIPIYVVDSLTPTAIIRESAELKRAHQDFPGSQVFHQGPRFRGQPVPIPARLAPSPGTDAHVAMVDYARGLAWDMWYVFQDSSGQWCSHTGMQYDLYGSGVFDPAAFPVEVGTSIHGHGPGRAAGVPIIAGAIMHHEVLAGKIEHKLAGALRYVAYQEFAYPPAVWTDGNYEGGIPEGAIIQLDPELDLGAFDLTEAEQVVARALQEYGMVIVDFARGSTLYAEGLWYDASRSWQGLLRGWAEPGGIKSIPVQYYRVLDPGDRLRSGGDRKKAFFLESFEMPRNCD